VKTGHDLRQRLDKDKDQDQSKSKSKDQYQDQDKYKRNTNTNKPVTNMTRHGQKGNWQSKEKERKTLDTGILSLLKQ
jgi:hypothetical protein